MILTDIIGVGGTQAAPTVTLPAHVGHEKVKANDSTASAQTLDTITVMVKPHPLLVPGTPLFWDGTAYKIGDDIKKRRRGQVTHHLTFELVKVSG